jgi:predicted acetyltransferase
VSHGARTTVSPGDLDGAAGDPAGRFRRLAAEDWAVADGVYREWATEAFGLRRSEGFWRHRVFEGWRDDPYVYAWADEDGTARGYLVYTFEDGDDGREMRVVELAYADDEARAQLYRFLRDHDSQVESVRVRGPTPVSTRLFDELADPRAAEVELRPGAMARLVDVPAALESFAYPGDVAGRVTVAVTDDHCPWNDATVRLDVADGTATCRETDADPDVRAGVGTLTQVAVGSHGVAAAERDGDLSVATPAARETLAALFPPEPVYLREGF